MKNKKDLKKEIEQILSDKLSTAIEAFQTERDQDFNELVVVKKAVETFEAEKADVQKTMGSLNTKKTSGLAEHNRLTQKLNWMNRQLKGKKGQADDLFKKLTELTVDPKTLNLLLTFKAHGGKNEEG